DSQADTALCQAAPAPSGHPHSIEPSNLDSQLLPPSDVLTSSNQTGSHQTGSSQAGSSQTGSEQTGLGQKSLGQMGAGQMGIGNSASAGDFDIDEAITPHFEKAERFLHPDQLPSPPPEQPSKSLSNPPPAKRVGQTNGGHSEHANRDWEQFFTGYSADVRGASHFQGSADDRLHLREGLPPESIHKFVPPPEASNFYSRLQAMASRQQAPASLSQHELSGDGKAASPPEPNGSSNGSSGEIKGAMKGNSPQDSNDEFHSHLENIHLPPQPDLEAIAESLYQESLQEEALKRELSAAQFQSSNEINTRSESDEQ
ncbi:MAG: hypothetical protein VKL39_22935, partial [Leptolyngbyaceae bacterium]|nr:hypothetical protein [Leptolyngbyaceae bacterium]